MAITGAPTSRRILAYYNSANDGNFVYTDELAVSSSDSVFGFLEGSVESSSSNEGYQEGDPIFDEEEDDESSERIRNLTKEALNELQEQGNYCKCGKVIAGNDCRSCLMKEVSSRLRNAGYNSAICRTKWRSEHKFIDVVDNSKPKKGQIRVIIELSFRADFEMAKASDNYNQLVNRLPEVFVGKAERLKTLIKIMCVAAKTCMKDKKMHIGPWRKQKYMQAKWFSTNYERIEETNTSNNRGNSNLISKPTKATSMLTMALMDMHRKAVAVV
ncbi:hypothetical protein RDABS01_037340 [Bienertia sinuspersici]